VKEFSRVFKYIWPQWPRIVVVVISAIIVSTLLSASFITVIPLLKVMTGQEGLRGWADRKVCQLRYGVDFHVPESMDFTGDKSSDYVNSLLVLSVKKNSAGRNAGLLTGDRIVSIGNKPQAGQASFAELLEELATTGKEPAVLHIKRAGEDKVLQLADTHYTGLKAGAINLAASSRFCSRRPN